MNKLDEKVRGIVAPAKRVMNQLNYSEAVVIGSSLGSLKEIINCQQKEIDDLRQTLRFYAKKDMYVIYHSAIDGATNDICFDGGKRARERLGMQS